MPRTKKKMILRCVFCHEPAKEIPGTPLLAGRYAAFRHLVPPVGCPKGDPLMPDEATVA